MFNISAAALLFFGTGFLQIMFSVASMQTHPGERVTMWCSYNIHVSGYLYWFKQTDGDVPITIVHMLYTESLMNVKSNYFNNFTKDLMVMDLNSKTTSLTINKVKMSDSGFYFCGDAGYNIKFGNGTRLEVKAHYEKRYNLKTTMVNYLSSPTVFTSEKYYTGISKEDHEESSTTSTEECSGDIYFKLTFLFGGIIFFSCIFPLCLVIIRERRKKKHKKVTECRVQQHDNKEDDSVLYSAVNFSSKSHKTAGRHAEYTTDVYTDT